MFFFVESAYNYEADEGSLRIKSPVVNRAIIMFKNLFMED